MSALRRVAVRITSGFLLAASLICWIHTSTFAQSNSNGYDDGDVTTVVEIAVSSDGTQVDAEVLSEVDIDSFDEVDSIEVLGDLYDANDTILDADDDPYDYLEGGVDLGSSTDGSSGYGVYGETDYCIADDEGDEDCDNYDGVSASVNVALPSITSITPTSGSIGTSGTITVQGTNLETSAGTLPAVSTSDSDITISVQSASDSQASLSYQISSQATPGTEELALTNALGTSNAVNFTVGYPPATVTGLSPSAWQAGTSFVLTITGTNFGTAPTVSVSGNGVSSSGATSSAANGTQTQTTITVAAAAPSQSVVVTVTPGYAGRSYTCNCSSGQSPDGTDTATVTAVTPAPQIMMVPNSSNLASCSGGTLVSTGGETDVFAGQQMLLCAAPPAGFTIVTANWSFDNSSDITGGFVDGAGDAGSQPSASGGASEAVDPNLNQSGIQFYFVNPGTTETASLQWTLSNGDPNGNSSSADFNIQGPNGNLLPTATMLPNNQAVQITNDSSGPNFSLTGSSLPDYNTGTLGIVFAANATLPSSQPGSFVWVQLINSDQTSQVDSNGSLDCPAQPESGLDNTYPYSSGTKYASDSPSIPLAPTGDGEYQRAFSATMYLMWDPAIPPAGQSSCSPATANQTSTCSSIPVPLGSVAWNYSGCTVNTLANQTNGTTWSLLCGIGAPATPQTAVFPTWSNSLSNSGQVTCGPHTY